MIHIKSYFIFNCL